MIGSFAALLLLEEMMRKERASAPNWPRISTNWGLGLVNWTFAAMVPASSIAAALWSGPGLLAGWHVALAFTALLLVRSFTTYWLHRLFHVWKWLWRIHKVHHADTVIDCTTALRNHPFEALATTALAAATVVLLGPTPVIVAAVEAVLLVANFWQHAAIRLPDGLARRTEWLLITPRLHILHHARTRPDHDSNFGDIVSLWDRMFGTFNPPRTETVAAGLCDEDAGAHSLPHQLASPFRT